MPTRDNQRMCLVALMIRMVDDAPLIVGANREEAYARGGEPPRLLEGVCCAAGGVDPTAGGTWLGVNEHDVVIAVTNRRKSDVPAAPRSRGVLVRELLNLPTATAAAERAARALSDHPYAGCNIVCADRNAAVVVQAGDWLRVRPLPSGVHVLTNNDINDGSDRRLLYALDWLGGRHFARADECVAALQQLCAQKGDETLPPVCLRGEARGTVSSSIIALRWPPARSIYLHAQGPPDCTSFDDYSSLLQQLHSPPRPGA